MVDRVTISGKQDEPTLEAQAAKMDADKDVNDGKNENNKDALEKSPDDLILGKFKTQADMEKAYVELENKLSGRGIPEKGDKDGEDGEKGAEEDKLPSDPGKEGDAKGDKGEDEEGDKDEKEGEEEGEKEDKDQAKEELEAAGVDYDGMSNYYRENGELTENHYEDMAKKAGLSREMIDEFIDAQEARAELISIKIHDIAGSEDNYQSMIQWAADGGYSEAEIKAYDKAVESGSVSRVEGAVKNLKAQFKVEGNFEPANILEGGNTDQGGSTYDDWSEIRMDMSDPRYDVSEAFRTKVKNKIARSPKIK